MFGKKRLNENEEYEFDQVYEKDYEGEFAEIPAEDPEAAVAELVELLQEQAAF